MIVVDHSSPRLNQKVTWVFKVNHLDESLSESDNANLFYEHDGAKHHNPRTEFVGHMNRRAAFRNYGDEGLETSW